MLSSRACSRLAWFSSRDVPREPAGMPTEFIDARKPAPPTALHGDLFDGDLLVGASDEFRVGLLIPMCGSAGHLGAVLHRQRRGRGVRAQSAQRDRRSKCAARPGRFGRRSIDTGGGPRRRADRVQVHRRHRGDAHQRRPPAAREGRSRPYPLCLHADVRRRRAQLRGVCDRGYPRTPARPRDGVDSAQVPAAQVGADRQRLRLAEGLEPVRQVEAGRHGRFPRPRALRSVLGPRHGGGGRGDREVGRRSGPHLSHRSGRGGLQPDLRPHGTGPEDPPPDLRDRGKRTAGERRREPEEAVLRVVLFRRACDRRERLASGRPTTASTEIARRFSVRSASRPTRACISSPA